MSREETNNRKRTEMSEIIMRLRILGWTTSQLAAWMNVSTGTVNTWRRGESMGTNVQRAELAKLRRPSLEKARVDHIADTLAKEADTSEAALAEDLAHGATFVAKFRRSRIDRIRLRVAALRELFR